MPTSHSANLFDLVQPKLPLQYGLTSCYLVLNDERYAQETIALRNTPELSRFVHAAPLTVETQKRWLAGQFDRTDALNFALVVRHRFAGTISLYNIEHGIQCEMGRLMVPNDGRRFYVLAGCMLAMSFAFEVLGLPVLYSVVAAENRRVLSFALRNGWKLDPRYDSTTVLNGQTHALTGLSFQRSDWRTWFAARRSLLHRILGSRKSES